MRPHAWHGDGRELGHGRDGVRACVCVAWGVAARRVCRHSREGSVACVRRCCLRPRDPLPPLAALAWGARHLLPLPSAAPIHLYPSPPHPLCVCVTRAGRAAPEPEADDRYAGRGGVFESISGGGSGPAKCAFCPLPPPTALPSCCICCCCVFAMRSLLACARRACVIVRAFSKKCLCHCAWCLRPLTDWCLPFSLVASVCARVPP